jgi:nonsense-mediated mRNA decay protein 3
MRELKTKFCPKCGREADRLFDGMCLDCFFEKKGVAKIPAEIVVNRCKYCGRYFARNLMGERVEDVIDTTVKKMFNAGAKHVKVMNYRVRNGKVYVSLKLDFDGAQKSEEHVIEINEHPVACQYCSMAETHYYNAILQIRAPAELIDEILEEVINIVNRMKSDRFAFISKIKRVKYGLDIYIGSKVVAAKIGKYLKNRFNAETKTTRKISGRKKGREVYKNTILILIR